MKSCTDVNYITRILLLTLLSFLLIVLHAACASMSYTFLYASYSHLLSYAIQLQFGFCASNSSIITQLFVIHCLIVASSPASLALAMAYTSSSMLADNSKQKQQFQWHSLLEYYILSSATNALSINFHLFCTR